MNPTRRTRATFKFYVQQHSMLREPGNGNESSNDYEDEENAYQAMEDKRNSVAQKRVRISVDNKAYKPTSESELSDDGKTNGKTRRKKKKKGGPSVSMGGAEQGLHSIPPRSRTHIPQLSPYDDGDVSIEGAEQDPHSIPPALRLQTPTPVFFIGGLLGSIVHYIIKVSISLCSAIVSFLTLLAFICGRVIGTIYDITLRRPGNWLSGISPRLNSFTKYLVLGLIIFGSRHSLRGSLPSYLSNLSFPSSLDVYQAPEVPAVIIVELTESPRRLENAASGLSADSVCTSEILSRLSALEAKKDTILEKPDFALHSVGAKIIPSLTSTSFEIRPQSLGSRMIGQITGNGYAIGRPPVTALDHEVQNGHCWPFAGGEGQLGVALASPIFIEEVTIDHIPKSIAFDIRSAPRQMEVWGSVEGKDNIARVRAWKEDRKETRQPTLGGGEDSPTTYHDKSEVVDYPKTLPKNPEYIRLANFTYDIHSPNNVQTFPVIPEIRELSVDFSIVALRVLNNWGKDDFTCLYRFRVHGQRNGEIPLMKMCTGSHRWEC